MNSEEIVKSGLCRCCLTKGRHKDITQEHNWNGIREVFSDILYDCFTLKIPDYKDSLKLICNTCVQRLREASYFKSMVLNSIKEFEHVFERKETEFVVVMAEADELKTERVKEEYDSESFDNHFDDADDIDFDSLKGDIRKLGVSSPGRLLDVRLPKNFQTAGIKPLPKKNILPKAPPLSFIKHCNAMKEKTALFDRKPLSKLITKVQKSEKTAHIDNVCMILNYSNITPFKSKSFFGYLCFYCRQSFKDPALLRNHCRKLHSHDDITHTLMKYGAESLVVYVDVTNLTCRLCLEEIPNLTEFKKHLSNAHKKVINTKYTDRVLPFKLTEDNIHECQVCGCSYETFGSLERHLNTHYRNYVCKDCGNGYVTKVRLKTHIKNMHDVGNFPCEICNKVFNSQQKLKNHIDGVHKKQGRFKCPHCKLCFVEYFRRQKHLVEEHGAQPLEYKCKVCDKVFSKRYFLSKHMKKDHFHERDFQCDCCAYTCFSKHELQVHMIKHNGEKIYECQVCKKAYARKKTLKEHMRIHNDDRRFTCAVCCQAFIQKCSLKGHIKTHHPEYPNL